ncbi:nucleolar protein 8 [Scleropages formosus]|uniref:Nucleolar protein 8 n=1 Tax=Scleropages formosus TaxID=113540 RepID=A0A8C9UYJ8_SCLFO|nr:nucleolar protein 8 [Scleropages formosus]
MEETKVGKRLYIGGLSHSISQKDIRDRFGKFGDVSHVEVITRHDETGTPLKTFGYININISDSSLKKCMTVLNKSKWKGGTLQIEMAKESFLHRLAQERQQVAENAQGQSSKHQSLVDSFKKAGVENFHMKAAVPGTEIPGHKNWVVSKFGRVLPVLHLKAQHKHKIFKYDPSKHSHNIKKLDSEVSVPTPVSELTWELQGGDDEMSKKRRGEFPPQTWTPAKMKRSSVGETVVASGSQTVHCGRKGCHDTPERNRMPSQVNCNGSVQGLQARNQQNGSAVGKKQDLALRKQHRPLHVFNGDTDSEDEIRMLVEAENACSVAMAEADEDNLEVVGEDYVATSNVLWALRVKDEERSAARCSDRVDEDRDYDSADTDEIVTRGKRSDNAAEEKQVKKLNTLNEDCLKGLLLPSENTESPPREIKHRRDVSDSESISSDEESEGDEDYEAMMASCYRLDLSLTDLEKLAKKPSESSEEESAECQESDSHARSAPCPRAGTSLKSAKKGNSPDDILAAILAESSSDEESNKNRMVKKNNKKLHHSLPAFMGTKSLMEETNKAESGLGQKVETDEDFGKRGSVITATLEPPSPVETIPRHSQRKAAPLQTPASKDSMLKQSNGGPVSLTSADPERKKLNFNTSTFEDDESQQADRPNTVPKCSGQKGGVDVSHGSYPSSLETAKGSNSVDGVGEKKAAPKLSVPHCELVRKPTSGSENAQKRQEDNQKRLAALQLRQKEAEEQKKLIQGALLHLNTPTASKGKHIVFESDTDSEAEQTSAGQTSTDTCMPQKTLFEEPPGEKEQGRVFSVKEFQKQASSKLFLSSEEEEDEEDGERFQIKPQFEGKAGQKLMELQSRFGTDERFRMDSRFLESDEKEAAEEGKSAFDSLGLQLEDEKKKNMEILQSLLHVNIKAAETSREAAKGKTFRDISALHYDPTREEHAAFESKSEEPKKESKAERRKKRMVAEKIPEVSKDIFYSVAVDLKETFGPVKDNTKQKEAVAWDQENGLDDQSGEDRPTTLELAEPKDNQESTEFKFSFFEDDLAEDGPMKDNYKVETLQRAKVSWHVDPRFQDSSSEDEDEQNEEEAEDQPVPIDVDEGPTKAKKAFFFFFEDDERLKEGPRMFCRKENLEDQREQWQEKRVSLIEDYRMKHKSARRRAKTSLKT